MMRKGVAWATLTLLTVGGLLSVYQLLFSVWMTAYPHVDTDAWRTWFYERLAITIVGVLLERPSRVVVPA